MRIVLILLPLLLLAGTAGAITRTDWNDGDGAPAISGERGVLDTVPYRPYSPGAYVAPAIPATATGGWTPATGTGAATGTVIMGADAVKLIEDASESIGMNDWGRILFRDMFGLDWAEVLDNATTATTPGTSESVLLSLLYGMNIVALAVVAGILVYSIVMGGVGTAHEGTPMGKGQHTIMTPVRSALAVAYLTPTLKGLSILQVLLLAGFAWSCSFSNYLWGGMLDYMHANGGQLVTQLPQSSRDRVEMIGQAVMQGLAVQAYYYSFGGADIDGGAAAKGQFTTHSWWRGTEASPDFLSTAAEDETFQLQVQVVKNVGIGDTFGHNIYSQVVIDCDSTSTASMILCAAHNDAIAGLVNELIPIAGRLVGSVHPASGVTAPTQQEYYNAIRNYENRLVSAYPAMVSKGNETFQKGLDDFVAQAKTFGWMGAGSYYWTLARFNEHAATTLANFPEAAGVPTMRKNSWPEDLSMVLDRVQNYTLQISNAEDVARSGGVDSTNSVGYFYNKVRAEMNRAMQRISVDMWIDHLTSGKDPIAVLSGMGQSVITAGTALFVAGGVISMASESMAGKAADFWTGSGALVSYFMTPLTAISGMLLLCGLFLTYYLPAVPFVLWIFGIVGLLIMVLEMLFAAPVWAAAHAIPGGEGLAGQYGRQGYMLYFAVLLRAPLMLCGMFAAMLAYTALIQLVAKGLKIYIASATGTHILGPISILAFIVLSTIMFVYLTHKAFSIITHLAEKVLAWIGSGAGSFNEAAEEQRMNRVFMMAGNMKAKPSGGGNPNSGGGNGGGGGNANNSGGGGNTNNSGGKLAQSDANQGQSGVKTG